MDKLVSKGASDLLPSHRLRRKVKIDIIRGYWTPACEDLPPTCGAEPYGSYGNGAAMRVSAAAYLNRRRPLEDAFEAADRVTVVTHDHPEGVKGARATTHAIWLAFQGLNPDGIRHAIAEAYDYDLSRSVDQIRPGYTFDETCQGTVPEAITCARESASFEDAVRNAISLGGDADTLGAIGRYDRRSAARDTGEPNCDSEASAPQTGAGHHRGYGEVIRWRVR